MLAAVVCQAGAVSNKTTHDSQRFAALLLVKQEQACGLNMNALGGFGGLPGAGQLALLHGGQPKKARQGGAGRAPRPATSKRRKQGKR